MGRKKKSSKDGECPSYGENTESQGVDTRREAHRDEAIDQRGKDLSTSLQIHSESNSRAVDKEDAKGKFERESLKDSAPRRRLFGRRRTSSESPRRRDYRKLRVEVEERETSLAVDGTAKTISSKERMSRKEMFYCGKPERRESQTNEYAELQVRATVDSSEEEMRHGKFGRERMSRRDFFNSTKTRRRLLSKSPFKIHPRCPLPTCCKSSESSPKEQKEKTNDNKGEFELSNKKKIAVRPHQAKESPMIIPGELESKENSNCNFTKGNNAIRRRRQRKMDTTKRSEHIGNSREESLGKRKSKSRRAIKYCCWSKKSNSNQKSDSETEDDNPPGLNPKYMDSTTIETNEASRPKHLPKDIWNQHKESIILDPSKLNPVSVLSKIKEVNVADEDTSRSKKTVDKLPKGKSSDICQYNYPEERNQFVSESIPDELENETEALCIYVCDTIKPVDENDSDQTKTNNGDASQNDFIKQLGKSDDDEDKETDSTQRKEHSMRFETADPDKSMSSDENIFKEVSSKQPVDTNIAGVGQKPKIRFRCNILKAKRCWQSQKRGNVNKIDYKPATMFSKKKSAITYICRVGEDTETDPVEKAKKSRKLRPNWNRTRKYMLTYKTKYTDAEDTKKRRCSYKDNPVKCVASLTTSTAETQGNKDKPDITHNMTEIKNRLNDIRQDTYPEALNPFADEAIKDKVENETSAPVISLGGTLIEDNYSTFDHIETGNDKPVDNRQPGYPEQFNQIAVEEKSKVESTQLEQYRSFEKVDTGAEKPTVIVELMQKSSETSVKKNVNGQKSKLRLKWNKVKLYWPKKRKCDNKIGPMDSTTMTTEEESDTLPAPTGVKDTMKCSFQKEKKRRKWRPNWKMSSRYILTDTITKYASIGDRKSTSSSNELISVKPVSSVAASAVETSRTTQKVKKTWRDRIHFGKRKRPGKKKSKTVKHQTADPIIKSKRSKKRWWTRKLTRVTKEENVFTDEESEDGNKKIVSKCGQDVKPLTAAPIKVSMKERRAPKWKMETWCDIKKKQRLWWKRLAEDSDVTDKTDAPPKKKSIFKTIKKALKPRRKSQLTSNSAYAPVMCDSDSDDKMSSTKLQGKVEILSAKKGNNSPPNKKPGLNNAVDLKKDRKLGSTVTKLREGWRRFSHWLDK